MNRIVLIGNGFDLAHGLATSYKHFIDDYWEGFMNHCLAQDRVNSYGRYQYDCITLIMPKDEEGGLILSDFLPDGENPYETPNKKIISYKKLKEKFDAYNNKNKFLSPIIEFNVDNKFLLHLLASCNREMGWVDIENEYYKFLISQFNASINYDYYENINNLNDGFNKVKKRLKIYLTSVLANNQITKKQKIETLIYDSFYLDELTENFKQDILNSIDEKIKNIKAETLQGKSVSLEDTILLENSPRFNLEIKKRDSGNRLSWKNYLNLKPNEFMFLDFNYTNIVERYRLLINDTIPSQIRIHGELNNSHNPIIFGYGDELEENYSKLENLQDNEYLENIKSIKYQETDNYKQVLSFINSDKYQVIILGHSCGNSDRTLLNTLFEHENCVSIKPYYYQYKDKETGEIKDNYSDMVRNISRSFTDKKSMRDKVVNKTYTDWFSSDV